MSLVGRVGRRRFRARLAMTALYALLIVGAVTTVYPFLLMISTGFKGPTDQNDNRLVPSFWSDPEELYKKAVEDKYAGNASAIASTRIGREADAATLKAYERFLMDLPNEAWVAGYVVAPNQVTSRLKTRYQAWVQRRFATIKDLNDAYIEENLAFQTVSPPNEQYERRVWRPLPGRKWDEWQEFKRTLPAEFRIPVRKERLYQEWLRSKYQNQLAAVPIGVRGEATAFEQIRLAPSNDVDEFEADWPNRRFVENDVERRWARVSSGPMPIEAFERAVVARNEAGLRREFSTRNYLFVLDYILLNGRALLNTAIFCLLAIGTQLLVNPVAAYALSRYPVRASWKILMFLLATMAFPAEVAMIPSFLLLKDLGLLNTFAALVLPGMASGYMIFLLKGFFDSLPSELYESAQIDGAKETTMMLRIALPLSKPVLGYLALLAFMGAYGAFLYAFLVVQDQRMWTLMVWIYQLQATAPKAVMMAAVALAALPTLVVFLLAQRVIMRGIVLPGDDK
ncbi:MAG: carbohydrate ABC transporter permease [Fimbriimonadaceae bacterium]|nr:carbohydrate ABC transporter permease [Fimbriimonadaceae bacterium]